MAQRFAKQRLSDMVATEIRSMIKQDGFQPGDKIYSEHELTKRLGVSRASVREAIRILEVSGLLSVHQGRGVFLRNDNTEEFSALTKFVHDHSDSIFEQFEIRLLIEPDCAARAARLATTDEIRELREILQRFEEHCAAEEVQGAISQDELFHTKIAKATRNRTLHVLMSTFARNLTESWITSLSVPGRQIKTITEHRAILDAIEAGNESDANTAMRIHLSNALAEIQSYTGTTDTGSSPSA